MLVESCFTLHQCRNHPFSSLIIPYYCMVFSLAMLKDQKTSWTLTIDMLQLQTVRSIHFPLTSGSPVAHMSHGQYSLYG